MHHFFEKVFDFVNHADHPQWDAAFVAMGFFGAGVFIILTMYLVGGISKAQQAYAQPAQPISSSYQAPGVYGQQYSAAPVYAPQVYAAPVYAQPTANWGSDVTTQFGKPRDLTN